MSPSPKDGRTIVAHGAAEGFGVGRSLRVDPGLDEARGTPRVSLRDAIARVRRDLQELARILPRTEAELFEPEARILEEVGTRLLANRDAGELRDAIIAETSCGCTDLVLDLRVRLLHALEGSSDNDIAAAVARHGGEVVILTKLVTPSLVASLPKEVVAIIGALDESHRSDLGRSSHAAILARGRGLPVAYVGSEALASISEGSTVIVEASESGASVFVEPSAAALAHARQRQNDHEKERLRSNEERTPLDHLGVEVRVNVASGHDDVPGAAEGIGLVRTEMMFAEWLTAPSESEQLAALLLVTAKARGRPIVVRLFDAGGDKPLGWLGASSDPARGIHRLLAHPAILATQMRALVRASEHADIRVLLPFVHAPDDVVAVRRLAPPALKIGAMIESPDAVRAIDSIASVADFLSIGTNDLTATALGLERTMDGPKNDPRVLDLIARVIATARARGREVSICGEMASDEHGARIAVGLGVNVLSVAPPRMAAIRGMLGRATHESCRAAVEAAMLGSTELASI